MSSNLIRFSTAAAAAGLALIGVVTIAAPAAASADNVACQPLTAAMKKLEETPSHQYVTETAGFRGGKPHQSELIRTADTQYLQINGRWVGSPIDRKRESENFSDAKKLEQATCSRVREESVNGESAVVYQHAEKPEGDSVSGQTWVSKSSGLPLRQEIDVDVGGGDVGKSHTSVRFAYTGVVAPAGAVSMKDALRSGIH